MRTILKIVSVAGILLSLGIANAQEAHPLPRHPGDVIKFQIKFDGPNADKITRVSGGLNLTGSIPKDQAGFGGGFGVNSNAMPAPKTFDLELKVPDNTATGDYVLAFSATAAEGSADYSNGRDFNIPPIRIENPRTFTPPSVTVKQLP